MSGDRVVRPLIRNPAAAVYGVLAAGLLLAAEDPATETYPQVVIAELLTITGYWIAHGYALWLGERLHAQARHAPFRDARRALGHEAALVGGALVPLVPVLLAWVAGAQLSTAVLAGLWTAAGAVVAGELLAGSRRGAPTGERVANALIGLALAGLLFGVRSVLH
ncbi:MAG TPA: hypothetical protein VFH38_12690 [Jatrophihabitans sp.]|nr:hypothetical protein [Jatrophihabitans sp.]